MENQPLSFSNQLNSIKSWDENPVYNKSYKYPFVHKQELHKQINSMLNQGFIRPGESP